MTMTKSTILIVDDYPINLKILLSFLENHDFEIRLADSGTLALEILQTEQPDLILLDIMMPELNGFETCKRIKANKLTANIPIIFMTALDSVENKVKGFSSGGVDYITKPFQQDEVLARINTHIELVKQKQILEETQKELLQQKELFEKMSITDDLTGLHNRRHLNTVLKREFNQSQRHQTDLSCLMLDLDHFKMVNDTYGHEFGDIVLQRISAILSQSIRISDFAFRFGGEEFVVILVQTDPQGALDAAEKIRTSVAAEKIYDIQSQESVSITVSIGVASFKIHQPQVPNDLINFADQALYMAKEKGRNKVLLHEPYQDST